MCVPVKHRTASLENHQVSPNVLNSLLYINYLIYHVLYCGTDDGHSYHRKALGAPLSLTHFLVILNSSLFHVIMYRMVGWTTAPGIALDAGLRQSLGNTYAVPHSALQLEVATKRACSKWERGDSVQTSRMSGSEKPQVTFFFVSIRN